MPRHCSAIVRSARRALAAWLALGALSPTLAVAQAAVAGAGAHPVEGPSFTPMALALLLVLALIGAAVWVLRRMGIAPRAGGGVLRLVTQLALGPRERLVIVEAGGRWWLLGVGAGGISRLGSMPKGEAPPAAAATPASFGSLLGRLRTGGQ